MYSRQRLIHALGRKIPDRVPMIDISYWPETLERWHKEGLPSDVDPTEYFDMDRISILSFDGSLGFKKEVIEESEEFEIAIDKNGVTNKTWKNNYAPPHQMEFKIKTEKDWLEVKERLVPDKSRISPDQFEELLFPLPKRIKKFCQGNNMFLILHCDGNVGQLIPLLIDIGYEAIQPLEVRAGNDVGELKKKNMVAKLYSLAI